MEILQQQPDQKISPKIIFMVVVSLGLTFWMMYAYLGPFQWIAEAQLAWWGVYYEWLTIVLTLLVSLVLIWLALWPFGENLFKSGFGGVEPRYFKPMAYVLVGLGVMGVGAWRYVQASKAGELTILNLADLESGKTPASMWVRVAAYPTPWLAMRFRYESTTVRYVPLVSTPEAADGQIYLFVRVIPGEDEMPRESQRVFEGMLERAGLPGPLRVDAQKSGMVTADNYYVLELKETPKEKMANAAIIVWVGAGACGLGLLFAVRRVGGTPPTI